jgi:radical SAM-linked protein
MARQRVPDGPPPPPVVQRVRIRYAKRGRMRFTSVRDFQRALERAVRRAEVPIAYSAGFHPHPRISYANAAPTGVASEAEYAELALSQAVDPEELRALLDDALPAGLDVVEAVESAGGALADRLAVSLWSIEFSDVVRADLEGAVAALLAAPTILVTKVTKSGRRDVDVRAAVLSAVLDQPNRAPYEILRVVARHTTPAVRPDDILSALRAVTGFEPSTPPLATRLRQGPWNDAHAQVADPLAATGEPSAPEPVPRNQREPGQA